MYSESDDDLHEYEYPDGDDIDDDDPENYSSDCPNCGAVLYDDAEYCPSCGNFVTHSTSPFAGKSAVWIVLGIIGIGVVIAALVFGSM